jgi:hypothetical protein
MKYLAVISTFVLALISGPALADDSHASCKANVPEGYTAAVNDAFCISADMESAGKAAVRAECMPILQKKSVDKRIAMASSAIMKGIAVRQAEIKRHR